MAKKSGISLNPGADTTLVAAATRAAMANVPKDLSGTFQKLAASYDATMKSVANSYTQAAREVGKLGGVLVGKAVEQQSNINKGDSYVLETEIEVQGPQTEEDAGAPGSLITTDPSDDAKPLKATKKTTIGDELRGIRKELFGLTLKRDKKSNKRRNELKAQRADFTNDIKILDDARNITDDQLTSGNVNFQNTGKLNLAIKQGMNALSTKTGIIDEGEFEGYKLTPSRDNNGKLGFMLKDKKGNFVTGKDDMGNLTTSGEKPHFVSAAGTKDLLEMKMDQKILNPIQKRITEDQIKSGKQGLPYMGNQLVNSFRAVLDNPATLRQLSDVRLGDDTKTLREHVESGEGSTYSAEIFSQLSASRLKSLGVDEMADGKAGYSEKDFTAGNAGEANFTKIKSAIFDKDNSNYDDGSHLKALTEKHIYNTGELTHGVGKTLYTPPKGTTTTTVPGKSYIAAAKSHVSYGDQDKKVDQAKAGKTLYDWDGFKYTTTDGGKTYTGPDGVNEPTADVLSGTRFGLSNRLSGTTFGGADSAQSEMNINDLFENSENFGFTNKGLEDTAVVQLKQRLGDVKGLTFDVPFSPGTDKVRAKLNGEEFIVNLEVPEDKIAETIADFEAWVKINK